MHLADDLTQIIVEAGLFAYGCAVSKEDWARLVTGDMLRALGDAERYCVTNCMLISSVIARKTSFEKEIAWVFDNRPHREDENYKVFKVFEEFRERGFVRRPKPTITFGSSKDLLPLQAADIIAWETFQAGKLIQKDGKQKGNSYLGRLNRFLKKKLLRVQFASADEIPAIVSMVGSRDKESIKGVGDLIESHTRLGTT